MSPQNQVVDKDMMPITQQLDKYITSTLVASSRKQRNLGKLFSSRHQVFAHKASHAKGGGFFSSTQNPSQTQYQQSTPQKHVTGYGTSRQHYFNQSITNFTASGVDDHLDRIGEETLQRCTSGADSSILRLHSIDNSKKHPSPLRAAATNSLP